MKHLGQGSTGCHTKAEERAWWACPAQLDRLRSRGRDTSLGARHAGEVHTQTEVVGVKSLRAAAWQRAWCLAEHPETNQDKTEPFQIPKSMKGPTKQGFYAWSSGMHTF